MEHCMNQNVAEADLLALLHNAEQAATAAFAQFKGELNVTLSQALILQAISQEPRSQQAIVRITGVDRSTLSDVVRRLEQCDLISREPDEEDSRRVICHITENGRAVAKKAVAVSRTAVDRLLQPIPAAQRSRFLSNLRAFVLAFQASKGSGEESSSGNKRPPVGVTEGKLGTGPPSLLGAQAAPLAKPLSLSRVQGDILGYAEGD
jgi:MarR family transcriptional regulator, lower aerobic nicotinate degradation pathway regulator